MTLLPVPRPPESPGPHTSGSREGSESSGLAPLDPFIYRDTRWCANCGGEQLFIEVFETEFARVGFCFGCGEEKQIRLSRATECAA